MDFLVQEGDTLFVMLPEEIDHYQTKCIAEWIDNAILSSRVDKVVFDFVNTRFMDSSGVGLIAGRYQKLRGIGGQIYVRNASERMAKILYLSGLEKIIRKYEETA